MSKKRKALMVLAVLVVAAIPAWFWLFTESTVPDSGQFTVDLTRVRALADALPGEKPKEIRFEEVGSMNAPSTGIVAGSGWSSATLVFYSFQLVWADRTVVIDTGMDKKTADETMATVFDEAAFARVLKAMARASLIAVTHEHYDHLGGAATAANLSALLPQLKLTREQVDHPEKTEPVVFPKDALKDYVPLAYDTMHALAPGVVLIKAPGHTPGSQLVYVKRADGAELLFLGDVAWHQRNVKEIRTRARLASLIIGEDRGGVLLQLKELNRLSAAEPAVQLVAGHDKPRIEALVAGGFLKAGFEVGP